MAIVSAVFQNNVFQDNAFQDNEWGAYVFQPNVFQGRIVVPIFQDNVFQDNAFTHGNYVIPAIFDRRPDIVKLITETLRFSEVGRSVIGLNKGLPSRNCVIWSKYNIMSLNYFILL